MERGRQFCRSAAVHHPCTCVAGCHHRCRFHGPAALGTHRALGPRRRTPGCSLRPWPGPSTCCHACLFVVPTSLPIRAPVLGAVPVRAEIGASSVWHCHCAWLLLGCGYRPGCASPRAMEVLCVLPLHISPLCRAALMLKEQDKTGVVAFRRPSCGPLWARVVPAWIPRPHVGTLPPFPSAGPAPSPLLFSSPPIHPPHLTRQRHTLLCMGGGLLPVSRAA